ncbi:putative transcription factor GTE7 [Iris pallida]|uniref:Transcription factor GTE7 n=1 Tax=Iris pallida TaxID=29817 RepID=A0AAX6EIP4_IRIPA|nr:putative transcription factor GTE7 [Iris pallida]
MALAMLASRNEPYWGDPKVYMSSSRKTPNPNVLTNPNPSSSNKRYEQNLKIEPADPRLASSSAAGAGAAAAASEDDDDDDSSSLKPPPLDLGRRREAGAYVTYKISNYSKKELRELKRRLICELDLVRSVASRIEAREQQLSAGRSAAASSKKIPARSETAIVPKKPPPPPRPSSSAEITKLTSAMMKRCGQILTKLTKHAGAVWFNSPVDVVALNLPDYHRIIKNPMDLGTVKSKLSKNLYSTPSDLAADIRLTFNNALTYNPPGHVVYNIAKQLLAQFEASFGPAYHKYEKHLASISRKDDEEDEDEEEGWRRPRDISSWSQQPQQVPLPEMNQLCVEPPTPVAPPSHPVGNRPSPVAVPSSKHRHQMATTTTKPTVSGKQPPKPRAKDQNKRPMTMDEKEKLTHALQDLPSDKMPQLLLIIQKRNAANLQAGGDEVELDFELMDNETLWELDRFVTNIKKSVSKARKQQQEAMSGQGTHLISAPTSGPTPAPTPLPHHAAAGASEEKSLTAADEIPGATAAKKVKKLDPVDEDVDIGEDLPVPNYPSVDIVKDTGCHSSSSSSSSSGSSSSSDSDSGSSSGSDSDEDDGAQSPAAAGSRPLPGN